MSDAIVTMTQPAPVVIEIQSPAIVEVTVAPTIVHNGPANYYGGITTEELAAAVIPTAAPGTNDGTLATTEFVQHATKHTHTQLTPSLEWIIVHNMVKHPSLLIIDSTGEIVMGDILYPDLNTMILTFSAEISGYAYLT
jgi:hypothetical protein